MNTVKFMDTDFVSFGEVCTHKIHYPSAFGLIMVQYLINY